MSEATQTLIPEDLRWLAENVSEWAGDHHYRFLARSEVSGAVWYGPPKSDNEYTRNQWKKARQALGLEPEEWPEDRIDTVALNGATGDHYPEAGQKQDPYDCKPATMADQYPRYYKDVRHLDSVDVYRVHRLFGVTDNELHHASKKLLLCGVRTGGKPARKEVEEARDTLNRWLEIQAEDEWA